MIVVFSGAGKLGTKSYTRDEWADIAQKAGHTVREKDWASYSPRDCLLVTTQESIKKNVSKVATASRKGIKCVSYEEYWTVYLNQKKVPEALKVVRTMEDYKEINNFGIF